VVEIKRVCAAAVEKLDDTCAAIGCGANIPDGASFTTIELKSNFLGTTREGRVDVVATAGHAGRTTQVWDAVVTGPGGRSMALFRCTQSVLWPR